jgi:hypothetical protein
MGKPKIPLIYVLSNGRSGSTLLDLLLGSHPNIWTLGEAQRLHWELKANNVCGCGAPISDCPFWKRILPNLSFDEHIYPIEYFRINNGDGRILHWNLLPGLFSNIINTRQKRAINIYGRVNADYLNVVWQTAVERSGREIRWLVDASKDVYRLFWLQKSGLFNLRVIHLLKSPSAFVYSMVKRDLPHAGTKAVRMTGRWVVENYIGYHLRKIHFPKEQTLLLHYEELARHPEITMARLDKWLGLDFFPEVVDGFRDYENHAISGNQMRWQNADIFLDEQWRTMLPASYQCVISFTTLPMRWLFGY